MLLPQQLPSAGNVEREMVLSPDIQPVCSGGMFQVNLVLRAECLVKSRALLRGV